VSGLWRNIQSGKSKADSKIGNGGCKMIVTERLDAKPICDAHHEPMQHMRYEASNLSMTFYAHACTLQGCTRVYQHGLGYHDIDARVTFDKRLTKQCPECETTMYLASVSPLGKENWECGQRHCGHKETVLDVGQLAVELQ
jgi:hypothetical protein